ncbi:MAG: zinc-dependent metalloprotease [Acidimicrobiia bacterium]|nr:zinc-dependent metalloprotease [Acidimicrobiia bacterium]
MTDNIFERLAELLQSAGPVNWRLGVQIAESIAGAADPVEPWVAEEYEELGRTSAMLIGRSGALDPTPIPTLTVIDPRGWAAANLEGYAYLAEPLAAKFSGGGGMAQGMGIEQIFGQLAPALVGLQVGSLVGTLARDLLGPFDAGLPPVSGGAASYAIVPNIEALAASELLDTRQTRLWAVMSEATHQALLAIPWVRGHLADLAHDYISGLEMRPDQLQERLQSLGDPSDLERLMSEPGGLTGFVAGPELDEVHDQLTALLAMLDGFGSAVVEEAGGALLPDLAGIRRAATGRHPETELVIEQMLGIEIDADLAEDARVFSADIAVRWGNDARDRLWQAPGNLPTPAELGDPVGWAARVLLSDEL